MSEKAVIRCLQRKTGIFREAAVLCPGPCGRAALWGVGGTLSSNGRPFPAGGSFSLLV